MTASKAQFVPKKRVIKSLTFVKVVGAHGAANVSLEGIILRRQGLEFFGQ